MLKINKILSKKGSNLSGFSLIELMVAVTILAMAIFGIFHAYSVGFLGMADARDRTVATNYAREAMEDVKNMDFEKITTTTKSVITSNRKYRIDVNVSLESPNLKKVFTVVNWKDRNGVGKTVETSMSVNFIEIYASEATKIVLYADSYSILNKTEALDGEGTFTTLTAVIKDIKGNTVIDWGTRTGEDGDITFTITERPDLGYLNETIGTTTISIKPTKGRASTIFTSSASLGETEVGYSVITASVNLHNIGNVSDSVTIKITNGPVKISLEADPDTIKASTVNYPTITASLQNATGDTLKKINLVADVEITFSVFGEGNPSPSTVIIHADGSQDYAIATTELCPTGNSGLANIIAIATDIESGKADVRFLGPPDSISISADPNPMYEDDDFSTIYVGLLDENGFNTNPDDTLRINLTLETSAGGDLEDYFFDFYSSESEGIINDTTFYNPSSIGTAIITASDGGSMEKSITIKIISSLVPDHIELSANPKNAKVGPGVGEEYISTIKAIVYDSSGKIVTNYDETIYFVTTMGSFYNIDGSLNGDSIEREPDNGFATAKLSSSTPGDATVTVSSGTLDDVTVIVRFYTAPTHIGLAFNPLEKKVKADGVETITIIATIYDIDDIIVIGYDTKISFLTTKGTFSNSNGLNSIELTPVNGVATAKLSSSTTGDATVTVSSGSLNVSEVLNFYEETTLTLVENETSPNYSSTDKEVTFDVEVSVDSITLDQMKVSWSESDPSERLFKIYIKNVGEDNYEEVYNGNVKSGTLVDITKTLSIGVDTIKLTFGQDMAGRQIDVMFYPSEGWYLIRFEVPGSS
jgi:prepilin-type N-terminal cleavage/methylation domain-containing protein